jgi:hypothetical protein
MAAILERVALTGTAVDRPPLAGANFGPAGNNAFFAYGVGARGAVDSYSGFSDKGLAKSGAVGFMADITALIPGGGSVFYAVTKDGKLNWYEFTGSKSGKPFNGPVTVGSGFGGYKQVFGGGDGVIYAIQNDGTLVWYRHAGFATGSGSVSAPKPINAGWGQFKRVFSAGQGVIYGIQPDGTLLWYRHQDYLTGDSNPVPAATPPAAASGTTITSDRLPASKAGRVVGGKARIAETIATAHFDGPTTVGSGWADFVQVLGAGDGVVLALQSDGKLQWYKHDDYLTGTSTGASGSPKTGKPGTSATSPSVWGAESAVGGSARASQGTRAGSLGGTWGAPAEAIGTGTTARTTGVWGGTAATGTPVGAARGLPGRSAGGHEALPATAESALGNSRSKAASVHDVAGETARVALGGTAHWEGPKLIDANSGWGAYSEIAASLPVSVHDNRIK